MKYLLLCGVSVAFSSGALAQGYGYSYGTGSNPNSHFNNGYINRNGTAVQPYYSTNPNNTRLDNYGTAGNVNPFNGQRRGRSLFD